VEDGFGKDLTMSDGYSSGLLATARALATDAVCADVVATWRAEGIESILLKGPTLAEWLYPGDLRPYVDADLLVAPSRVMDAAAVLARLGFEPTEHHVSLHAHPWFRRADGAEIDLHVRLWGLHYPADRVWRELGAWLEFRELASVTIRTLNLPGRALHVALHAAQHVEAAKPREDLRRALSRAPDSVWRDAERLADRVGGLQTMALGLALQPEGERLIDRLPLVQAAMIADPRHAPLAIGLTRLSTARGVQGKLGVLVAALSRPQEDIDREPGSAAALRFGTPAARIWHVLTLLAGIPRTMMALRRGRRAGRHGGGPPGDEPRTSRDPG
jgi:hypothetical protein